MNNHRQEFAIEPLEARLEMFFLTDLIKRLKELLAGCAPRIRIRFPRIRWPFF